MVTTLLRAENLEKEISLSELYLKLEGENETGTHKDRTATLQSRNAKERGFSGISVATCGNYGVSIANEARKLNLNAHIFIPRANDGERVREMEELGARIIFTDGHYEESVQEARKYAAECHFYDGTAGGASGDLQIDGYKPIAHEIVSQLSGTPDVVALPMSNGTTVVGLWRGFRELYAEKQIDRYPKIIGVTTEGQNPILTSFLRNLDFVEDLPPKVVQETWINEPLVNYHSFDGELALQALYESKGLALPTTDDELLLVREKLLDREGVHVIPAAVAGLAGLMNLHRKSILSPGIYVAILTARDVMGLRKATTPEKIY